MRRSIRGTTDDWPTGGIDQASAPGKSGNQLPWILDGAFALVLDAWIVMFLIAHRHPVAPVPLTTQRAGG
jgi:hypothetical protein